MNRCLVAAMLLIVGAVSAENELDYPLLRASAWAQNPETDFRNLRFATAEHPDYDPFFSISADYRRTLQAVRDGDPVVATEICDNLSVTYFVAIQMQIACAERLLLAEQVAQAERHRFIAGGLLSTLSPNAAGEIVIINPDEHYDFTSLKRYEVLSHATLRPEEPGAQPRSGLEVRDENGEVFWVYFVKHPAYDSYQRSMINDALDAVKRDHP